MIMEKIAKVETTRVSQRRRRRKKKIRCHYHWVSLQRECMQT